MDWKDEVGGLWRLSGKHATARTTFFPRSVTRLGLVKVARVPLFISSYLDLLRLTAIVRSVLFGTQACWQLIQRKC